MKHLSIFSVTIALLGTTTIASHADTLGYVGVTTAYTEGDRGDGLPTDDFTSFGIEGLVSYEFSPGLRVAFEADLSTNSGGEVVFGSNVGAGEVGQVAAHLLYDLNAGPTVGAFVALGVAESEADDPNETYGFNVIGLQGSMALTDRIGAYAQLAYVDQPDDTLSSGGYADGYAFRLGGTYDLNETTGLFADIQLGEATAYEDSDEDGEFMRFALGGETMIGASPWAVNYELAHETYDALNDDNRVEITTLNVGVRYYFGATRPSDLRAQGLNGIPDIISRASLFTEALD